MNVTRNKFVDLNSKGKSEAKYTESDLCLLLAELGTECLAGDLIGANPKELADWIEKKVKSL
jgi:hypothetical protein